MIIKFSEETQRILKKSKIEMQKLKHPFIGSEHLLLSILNENNIISSILKTYKVTYNSFRNMLINIVGMGNNINNCFIYTPLLKRILEDAYIEAKESNNKEVGLNNLFLSLLDEDEGIAVKILLKLGVNIDKLYEDINKGTIKNVSKKLVINECSIDFTKKAKDHLFDPLIGREKEVNELIEILCRRNKNNPLLIGEAGVGKTAIVEELASRIVNNNVPDKLKNMKVLSLSMASLVSGTKYRGEFEERVTKIIKELETNKDIIVFIDEMHTLVGAGGAEGAIDASNILKPALARGNIKVIGATTINEYKDSISKDKALNRRFQTIIVKENTLEETKNILYQLKSIYEEYHNVSISDIVINKIVELSDKYITEKKNPDKSIDILDTICTKVSLKNNNKFKNINDLEIELKNALNKKNNLIIRHRYNEALKIRDYEKELEIKLGKLSSFKNNHKRKITINDVANVIEKKSNIPIYEINNNKKIIGLEKYLKEKIIGQDDVINEITLVTKKIFLGLKNNLPYSILFLGKSGVGKTLLVKEYSKYLDIPLIRLDMGEYKESHSVSKIIGSPPGYVGYNEYNNVLEKVRNNPYSIILLDEIEKAHPDVINVFLSILDEGEILDSHGEKVNFKNTLIIMTSNIKSNDNIGFNKKTNNDENIQNVLSTIFVNRINKICYFNELSGENIKLIIKRKIKTILEKYNNYNIKINISNSLIDGLINEVDYFHYGARKINKVLEDKIDNLVIEGILNNKKNIKIS